MSRTGVTLDSAWEELDSNPASRHALVSRIETNPLIGHVGHQTMCIPYSLSSVTACGWGLSALHLVGVRTDVPKPVGYRSGVGSPGADLLEDATQDSGQVRSSLPGFRTTQPLTLVMVRGATRTVTSVRSTTWTRSESSSTSSYISRENGFSCPHHAPASADSSVADETLVLSPSLYAR